MIRGCYCYKQLQWFFLHRFSLQFECGYEQKPNLLKKQIMTYEFWDLFKNPDVHVQRLWVHTVASSVHMQDVFVSSGMKGKSVRRRFSTYSLLSPNRLWSHFWEYRTGTHNPPTLSVVHNRKTSGALSLWLYSANYILYSDKKYITATH